MNRQLIFEGVGKLRWHEVIEPTLAGPKEALVRPIAAARCDLDPVWMMKPLGAALRAGVAVHFADAAIEDLVGKPALAPPFPIGHECVAQVLAVGADVRSVHVGQRVIVPFQVACGECRSCTSGLSSRCSAGSHSVTTFGFGHGAHLHGGVLCDTLKVPYADAMLVALPTGVDAAAVASASDNLPDAYRSVAQALLDRPNESVLIVGGAACSVGLYAAGIARALGAGRVDYVDDNRERLEIAERLGVRAIETKWPLIGKHKSLPDRYAISVDARSDMAGRGLELALRSLEPGGTCTSVSIYPKARTPLPLMQMYRDGIGFRTGITNARSLIPKVLELVSRGAFDPSIVSTLVAPWDEADRAFLERTTKVVVTRELT